MEMTAIEITGAAPAMPRFTVDAKPLADALAFMTGRIIAKGARFPILANVALVAWPERLDIIATDLDISARVSLPCIAGQPGAFTLDASALLAIAKKAGAGALLAFTQEGNRIAIDTGASVARLNFLPADDFPMMDPIGADCHAFTLSADFAQDLARVAPFIETSGNRFYLQGVALQRRQLAGRDRLLMAATNGNELSAWSRPVPAGAECLPDVILPAKLVKALQAMRKITGETTLSAEFDRRGLLTSIECGPVLIMSKLIDGTFPDIENIAAASIGDAPAQALLIPELDPEMNPATLERMAKATGAALAWENVGGYLLASDPANPDWFGMAAKGGMPKGYSVDYAQGEQSAARYLVDLAERRGLDAGAPDDRKLIVHGGNAGVVYGLTVGAQVYVPAKVDYAQDWETFTMRKVETPARWDYVEGAYSIPMPRERATLEAACSLTVDGQTYPLATNSRGDIHLSKEAVRGIIGESCFETMAITLPDGRAAYILQWLWDEGVTRFCTVRADGRCATGKAGDGTAGIMITRAEIERGAVIAPRRDYIEMPAAGARTRSRYVIYEGGQSVGEVSSKAKAAAWAKESPAPIDEPAPENLPAQTVEPESATHERPEAVSTPSGPEIAPAGEIAPGDDIAARLDALEMAVKALQAAPVAADVAQAGPKRTAAHERAIRRAWKERQARREAQAHRAAWKARRDEAMERAKEMEAARDAVVADCERAEYALSDAKRTMARMETIMQSRTVKLTAQLEATRGNMEKWAAEARKGRKGRARRMESAKRARRMIATYRANAQAMRQTAAESTAGLAQAIAERNAAQVEIASLKRSLADPTNPIRATDAVRLIDEARELRAKVATLTAHNANMRAMVERGGDQLEQMISRVTRAESILRKAGLLPALVAVDAPRQVAA